jgi:hypothetical protein
LRDGVSVVESDGRHLGHERTSLDMGAAQTN